jgi:hypothetical protein
MIFAEWAAGNGGGLILLGLIVYQAVIVAIPIIGLASLKRRPKSALAAQVLWIIVMLPLLPLVVSWAVPPAT